MLQVLDPALTRPGRLSRRVVVPLPDEAGRADILAVHLRNTPMTYPADKDFCRRQIARISSKHICHNLPPDAWLSFVYLYVSVCVCLSVSLSLCLHVHVCLCLCVHWHTSVLCYDVLCWVGLGWAGLGWVVKDLSEMEVGLCMRNEALQLVVSIVSILPCALWTPTVANSRMALVLWVSSPFWSAALRCLLASLSHPFGELCCTACLQGSQNTNPRVFCDSKNWH